MIRQFQWSLLFIFFVFSKIYSQQTPIKSSIDRDTIYIGEEMRLRLEVTIDSLSEIVFPEIKNMGRLEVIESYLIDTTRQNGQLTLVKEYGLTQFDSGLYLLPAIKLRIDTAQFSSDSFQVYVRDVIVDTTKQGMYPIKDSIDLSKNNEAAKNRVWWVVGIAALILIITVLFLLYRRKKQSKTELPPYEWALERFKILGRSPLIEEDRFKEFYTELTFTIRQYLDWKVDDSALESTSEELLQRIKTHDEIPIKKSQLIILKQILHRADMAKFAKSRSDAITAKEDRIAGQQFVQHVKDVLPEPTEDELQQNREYLESKRRKKIKKRWLLGMGLGLLTVIIAGGIYIATTGIENVRDVVLGNKMRDLAVGQWYTSIYGTPSVQVETPETLLRTDLSDFQGADARFQSEFFMYKTEDHHLHILLKTILFTEDTEMDLLQTTEHIYSIFENMGFRNILMKDEPIAASGEQEGYRQFGSMTYNYNNKEIFMKYEVQNFITNEGLQQIAVIYAEEVKDEDRNFAKAISERVLNSIVINPERE